MPALADTQPWVEQAQKHTDLATTLHGIDEWPFAICMHAQQAIEMALKGVIIASGLKAPYTHDLEALYRRIPTSRAPVPTTDQDSFTSHLHDLTECWRRGRYPAAAEGDMVKRHRFVAIGMLFGTSRDDCKAIQIHMLMWFLNKLSNLLRKGHEKAPHRSFDRRGAVAVA